MGQQPKYEIGPEDRPRSVPGPAPPRRWKAARPGDLHRPEDVPSRSGFGNPGPDSGYALRLVAQADLPLDPDERRADVETTMMHLMVARASHHGKAPSKADLQFATMILGLASVDMVPATANASLATIRRHLAPRVAHSSAAARSMVGKLPPDLLGLDLDEVRHRLALGESPLA